MGRPCRDLRWWRGLFPGSCDALSSTLAWGKPEPGNWPGLFFADSKHPTEVKTGRFLAIKMFRSGSSDATSSRSCIRVLKCSIAVSTTLLCKASNRVAGNGRSTLMNAPPNPEKPKPEGWQSAPWSFWWISCWRESPSRRPLDFSIRRTLKAAGRFGFLAARFCRANLV